MAGYNNYVKRMITRGLYEEAQKHLYLIKSQKLEDFLFLIGYNTSDITAYSFSYFILTSQENRTHHFYCIVILSNIFPYLHGYECSLHHIQKALEIDPQSIELNIELLLLNDTPPKITNGGPQRAVTNKEAREIAKSILKKNPTNEQALDKLSWLDKTQENDLPPVLPSDDINDTIQQTISAGRFLDMRNKINLIDQATLKSILFDIAKEKENICAYAFPWFLILEHGESALYHELAADVLIEPFSQLVGAFYAARYHINRALELDPNNKQLEKKHNEIEKIIKNKEIENNENQ
jgi:tetratricopeptide (TPR) repeat protein